MAAPDVSPSWDLIFKALNQRRLEEIYYRPPASHEEFVKALYYLRQFYPDNALCPGMGITDLSAALLDVLGPTEMAGMHPQFVVDTVRLLRSIEHIDGFNVFARRFASHRGMWNQLAATAYLARHLQVIGIERKFGSQDIDVVASVAEERVFFHIKTLDQFAKMKDQFTAYAQISDALRVHPGRPQGKRLEVAELHGVVPPAFEQGGCKEIVFGWPYEAMRHEWMDEKGSLFVIELTWVPDEQLSFTGQSHGVNPFRNLQSHVEHIEKQIPNPAGASNVLIGVVGFPASAQVETIGPIEPAETLAIDASVFLAVDARGDPTVTVRRSKVHGRPKSAQFAQALEAKLPASAII